MSDQEQYVNEAIEDGVITIEDTFPMAPKPIVVPDNIDALISQHMLNLFDRYRDANIPGTVLLTIKAEASAGARELAVEFHSAVGNWCNRAEFKSSSLKTSFEYSVARYREQTAHAILALPAS